MAETVVHEHIHDDGASGSSSGIILAVVVLLILAFLIIFGVPFVRGIGSTAAPQVNIPGKVDVNIHNSGSGGGK